MSDLPAFLQVEPDPAEPAEQAEPGLEGRALLVGLNTIAGWVIDHNDLSRRFAVELSLDGWPVRLTTAQTYVDDLARRGLGDGRYGFAFHLSSEQAAAAMFADVRLANLHTPVGGLISLHTDQAPLADLSGPGRADWNGDLLLSGWVPGRPSDPPPMVRATLDGNVIAETRATRWMRRDDAIGPDLVRAYDLFLPESIADGRLRTIAVVTEAGEILPGSPCPVLVPCLAETLHGNTSDHDANTARALLRRHRASGVPFTLFEAWAQRFPSSAVPQSRMAVAVAIVGDADEQVQTTVNSLLEQTHKAWTAGVIPSEGPPCCFNNEAMAEFLTTEAAGCVSVVVVLAGTSLRRDALAQFAAAFEDDADSSSDLVYPDVILSGPDGTATPLAFPAFDYERWLEQGYGALAFAIRRRPMVEAVRASASSMFGLAAAAFKGSHPMQAPIGHLPLFLATIPPFEPTEMTLPLAEATRAHLAARGIAATIEGGPGSCLPAVHILRLPLQPSVSIVIPMTGRPDALSACLHSIAPAAMATEAEIILVSAEAQKDLFNEIRGDLGIDAVEHVTVPGPGQMARLLNEGAAAAGGALVCFLGCRIRASGSGWLDGLIDRFADGEIGCVGPLLVGLDGLVDHAGYVLRPVNDATPAFSDHLTTEPGPADILRVAHEVDALSWTALVVRHETFDGVGGFDDLHFPSSFGDVDFGLRVRATGKRNIVTPLTRLAVVPDQKPGFDPRRSRAARAFEARWADVMQREALYNPNLAHEGAAFTALAWPPRYRSLRFPTDPVARPLPLGW